MDMKEIYNLAKQGHFEGTVSGIREKAKEEVWHFILKDKLAADSSQQAKCSDTRVCPQKLQRQTEHILTS